ncbi:MAG TPA: serine hydrolase domain-containing protein [Polyangia bacterium]|nr:serine hydrolase domain-containing protein [Polyangia bacterium]
MLRDAVGVVFPAAQLIVCDRFSLQLDRAVGDCTSDTLFDIASLTKPLATATLTMHAIDARQLSLATRPRPEMTIAQLLAHASGLPAWKPLGHSRAEVLRTIADEPLESAPGTRSVYSDLGFILLGATVESALAVGLDRAFAERVATPLGIGTTYLPRDPAACAPTEGDLRGVVHDENARALGGVAGHAGLFSTARDVSRIAHSLVAAWHGARSATVPRVLPQARVRELWTPSGVPGSTWCLGWDRPAPTNSSAGTRWPRDGVGHLGFTGCSLWIDPPRARWVVLLSNRVHPTRANEQIRQLRPALHDAVVAALDD